MGFWSWLTGRPPERGVLIGDNGFALHVVGTSWHQAALVDLFGERTPQGVHHYCAALLTPQPDAASEALIVGGWDRGGHDWGYFGVRLNAFMPFECVTAEVYEQRRHAHQG